MCDKRLINTIFLFFVLIYLSGCVHTEQRGSLSSEFLCEYGIELYREGNIQEAAHEFRKALVADPHNSTAKKYLQMIFAEKKAVPQAVPEKIPAPRIIQERKPIREVAPEKKPTPEAIPEKKPVPRITKVRALPEASFTAPPKACIDREISFSAKFNQSDIQDKLTYKWDFGDGATAKSKTVKKTYTKPGIYKVKLTVGYTIETRYSSSSAENVIKVYSPPVAVAGGDIISCVDRDILFDGTRSYVTNNIERCFCCPSLTYIWDFGDGTPKVKGAKVKHKYSKAGRYLAILFVRDGKGRKCSTSQDTVEVMVRNNPAIIIRRVNLVCPGTKANFSAFIDASVSPHIDRDSLKYVWDFGDGSKIEGSSKVSHTYQKGGKYLVKVAVDDQRGTSCSRGTATLDVRMNTLPVAKAGPNLVCCVNTESIFNASSSYDADGDTPLTYMWDFGDGSKAEGVKVSHVYKKLGTYTVTLTVDDNSKTPCSRSVDSFTVVVHDKPVPIIKVD